MAELAQTDKGPGVAPVQQDDDKAYSVEEQFLAEAVKRFNRAETAESSNRMMALDDLRFKSGEQWPDQIKAQRSIDKRPCLTINKMKTFVHQITNDQRQNRPAINVSPVGDKADPETAKMLRGLIRQIERQSNADIAYDTGFDNAVSNGWGYWRVTTEYESEKTFDQVLKISRIRNPFRVYWDPDSTEPDGSDVQWCFITDLITRDEFEDRWPDATVAPWTEGTIGDEYKAWFTQTHVRVAEYFCFETKTRRLLALANGHIGYEDELAPEIQQAIKDDAEGWVVNEREVSAKQVKWYTITAYEILDETDWPGRWIPVVKCIGDEVDIEGKVTYAGLVRDAKDAQRMYNFWRTMQTEFIALQPKAPWIMEEGQVEGHEQRWKEANVKNLPYLLYKGTSIAGKPSPAPQRQPMPAVPAGIVQATVDAAQDMQATTGIRFDATMNERMYDESGKALRELKRVGDLGNFHYIDNLARSLRHTGRILIDLIPKIYDTRRVLTILREDDSEQVAVVDPTQGVPYKQEDKNGKVIRIYNPKVGDYDVAVTIGPSYATKRSEAADSILQFIKAFPPAAQVAGDLIAKNMDWPGADEIAARLASMLPPALQEKSLENLPPEAKGVVGSLMQQLQQLKGEHDKALAMLGDAEADRQVQRDKINADFSAKMQQIKGDLLEEFIKLQAKQGESEDLQMQKLSADLEAKLTKVFLDYATAQEKMRMERELREQEMEQDRELSADELAANVMVEGERIASDERMGERAEQTKEKTAKAAAKPKKGETKQAAPVINIHIGGGKKKITKGKDGSYLSEDVDE